jgi:hypothetical protein
VCHAHHYSQTTSWYVMTLYILMHASHYNACNVTHGMTCVMKQCSLLQLLLRVTQCCSMNQLKVYSQALGIGVRVHIKAYDM